MLLEMTETWTRWWWADVERKGWGEHDKIAGRRDLSGDGVDETVIPSGFQHQESWHEYGRGLFC